MSEELKTRVTFTMTVKPDELELIKTRAERMRIPISRLMDETSERCLISLI